MSVLPPQGPIACRKCYDNVPGDLLETGRWRAVNDPGAWGSPTPRVLVLGFSKGFTQADAYKSGPFADVPFRRMRSRLAQALCVLGLDDGRVAIDDRFSPGEQEFGFGSLVRCSLSRLNAKTGKRECTGAVMPLAFREEIRDVVKRCATTFLRELPESVEVVVMLGTTDSYVDGCRSLIKSLHPITFREINNSAYRTGPITWVHIAHPSGMNGHFDPWIAADHNTSSGRKCIEAQTALGQRDVGRSDPLVADSAWQIRRGPPSWPTRPE